MFVSVWYGCVSAAHGCALRDHRAPAGERLHPAAGLPAPGQPAVPAGPELAPEAGAVQWTGVRGGGQPERGGGVCGAER